MGDVSIIDAFVTDQVRFWLLVVFVCLIVSWLCWLLLRKSILWKLVKSQIFDLFVNSHITASSVRRS